MTETEFAARRMYDKLSVFKCLDCEKDALKRSEARPYLIDRVGRGRFCPRCGSHRIKKISVSMVMNRRWAIHVRKRLDVLRQIFLASS